MLSFYSIEAADAVRPAYSGLFPSFSGTERSGHDSEAGSEKTSSSVQPLYPAPFGAQTRIAPPLHPADQPGGEQERSYLDLGRAAQRLGNRNAEKSAASPENGLPGAANPATHLAGTLERGQAGGEEAAIQARPGERLSGKDAAAARSSEQPASSLSGADEVRSAERSFMGGASSSDAKEGEKTASNKSDEASETDDAEGQGTQQLSKEEQAQVEEMKKRDREVRTHEQAHIAAGGNLVQGGASYKTETGPDGKAYAVGGEVQIDTSEGSTPDETISKARRVKAAALAPAEPSAQDRAVAAQAAQMDAAARTEKREEARDKDDEGNDKTGESESNDQKGAIGAPTSGASLAPEAPGIKTPGTEAPDLGQNNGSSRLAARALAAYESAGAWTRTYGFA